MDGMRQCLVRERASEPSRPGWRSPGPGLHPRRLEGTRHAGHRRSPPSISVRPAERTAQSLRLSCKSRKEPPGPRRPGCPLVCAHDLGQGREKRRLGAPAGVSLRPERAGRGVRGSCVEERLTWASTFRSPSPVGKRQGQIIVLITQKGKAQQQSAVSHQAVRLLRGHTDLPARPLALSPGVSPETPCSGSVWFPPSAHRKARAAAGRPCCTLPAGGSRVRSLQEVFSDESRLLPPPAHHSLAGSCGLSHRLPHPVRSRCSQCPFRPPSLTRESLQSTPRRGDKAGQGVRLRGYAERPSEATRWYGHSVTMDTEWPRGPGG